MDPATPAGLTEGVKPTPPADQTIRHLATAFVVVAGFALATFILRTTDAPGDLDLAVPILLFHAILWAEYQLLWPRKHSFHLVIYRHDALLGRLLRGRFMAFFAAAGLAASEATGFTLWAISADNQALWIIAVCTVSAAAMLALVMDLIETQTLDPHARHVAVKITGWVAGVLTAGWLGHHLWTTMSVPQPLPTLLQQLGQDVAQRGDVIGLLRLAARTASDAQVMVVNQIPGVGLKVIYVTVSVLVVFLILRSALVLVAALTLRERALPRGPLVGLAANASIVLFSVTFILFMLIRIAAPGEAIARSLTLSTGELNRVSQAVGDAFIPAHARVAEFRSRHLAGAAADDAVSHDTGAIRKFVHDELLAGLDARLASAIGTAQVTPETSLQQQAAATIARTLSASGEASALGTGGAGTYIAQSLCDSLDLGLVQCWLAKAALSRAVPDRLPSQGGVQAEIALHSGIEQAAGETLVQLIRTKYGHPAAAQ